MNRNQTKEQLLIAEVMRGFERREEQKRNVAHYEERAQKARQDAEAEVERLEEREVAFELAKENLFRFYCNTAAPAVGLVGSDQAAAVIREGATDEKLIDLLQTHKSRC